MHLLLNTHFTLEDNYRRHLQRLQAGVAAEEHLAVYRKFTQVTYRLNEEQKEKKKSFQSFLGGSASVWRPFSKLYRVLDFFFLNVCFALLCPTFYLW